MDCDDFRLRQGFVIRHSQYHSSECFTNGKLKGFVKIYGFSDAGAGNMHYSQVYVPGEDFKMVDGKVFRSEQGAMTETHGVFLMPKDGIKFKDCVNVNNRPESFYFKVFYLVENSGHFNEGYILCDKDDNALMKTEEQNKCSKREEEETKQEVKNEISLKKQENKRNIEN